MQLVKIDNYPDQVYLKQCFEYNENTGMLRWKERPASHFGSVTSWKSSNRQCSGRDITYINDQGYVCVRLNNKQLRVHRVIWIMVYGYNPVDKDIDHINQIRDDNRLSNLRVVSRRGNNINGRIRKNNSSGVTGITWDKNHKFWEVRIWKPEPDRRYLRLGYFKELTNAVLQRYNAEKKYKYSDYQDKSSGYYFLKKNKYPIKQKDYPDKGTISSLFKYCNFTGRLIWNMGISNYFSSKKEYTNWVKTHYDKWVKPTGYNRKRGLYVDCFGRRYYLAEVVWLLAYDYITEADLAYKDNNMYNLHHRNLVETSFEYRLFRQNAINVNGVRLVGTDKYRITFSGQHKLNKTRDNIIDACLCRYHYEKKFRTLEDYPTNSFAYRYLKEHGIKTNQDLYISFDYINEYFKLKGKKILFNKRPPYHFLSKEDWRNWNKIYSDQEVPVTEDGYLDVGEGTWSKDMITYILNYHFIPEIKDENPLDEMLNKSKK